MYCVIFFNVQLLLKRIKLKTHPLHSGNKFSMIYSIIFFHFPIIDPIYLLSIKDYMIPDKYHL